MSQKNNIFHGQFIKQGDKLVAQSSSHARFEAFVKALESGQVVDLFAESTVDSGTLAQLAKIHACIRELAKETGTEFGDMKDLVKMRTGFCIKKEVDGELITKFKHFSKASKEDLALVIEGIIKMGDLLNVNCR